jgi:hypothetical protein
MRTLGIIAARVALIVEGLAPLRILAGGALQ